jgi:putative methanogenesis marker protein 2
MNIIAIWRRIRKMTLESLAHSIRNFSGASRKMPIIEITKKMHESLKSIIPSDAEIVESFGEDCAVIDVGDRERYLLFKAEEMWHELVEVDPKFAGYCSILVNVNDVSVKGGKPTAVVNTLATTSTNLRDKIVVGIIEGCKKFNVPMVGGHHNPDAPFNALSVCIVGMVRKNSLIRSDTARPGNVIIFGVDLDGHFHDRFKFAWDTTTHKSRDDVENKLKAIREIGSKRLVTAAKDISNPGVVGTLGMLLDASSIGGEVNMNEIPKPPHIELDQWLKAYPGFGVVLTTESKKADACMSILRQQGVEAKIAGKTDESRKLSITDGEFSAEVFDFRKDKLAGKP